MKNFFLCTMLLLFVSCREEIDQHVNANDGKQIISFKFLAEENVGLNEDVDGKISDSSPPYIELVMPKGVPLDKLKPLIEYEGGRIQPDLGQGKDRRFFDFTRGLLTFVVINDEENSAYDEKESAFYYVDVYTTGQESNMVQDDITVDEDGNLDILGSGDEDTNIIVDGLVNSGIEILEPITLAYFPSWSENWAGEGGNSKFRSIPSYVNVVFLSFAKPNMRYEKGSYDISATGIQTPYGGFALLESINALNNKGIKVILSVGGETYWGGALSGASAACYDINYQGIKDFLDDFNISGVDWDYEPGGFISILSEEFHVNKFIEFVTKTREIMPKGEYLVACAPSGVGALGGAGPQPNGIDDSSSPYNNDYGKSLGGIFSPATVVGASPATLFGFASSGHFIPVMKEVGSQIDIVAYQGYNVGGSSDRKVMYDAYAYYANIYGFVVVAGTHVATEPWGPYYYFDNNKIADLSEYIYNGGSQNRQGMNDGIMIWELLAPDPNNNGYEFMKIAHEVLKGTSKASAISIGMTAGPEEYTGGGEVSVSEGDSSEGGEGSSSGELYCGYPKWDANKIYSTRGSKVYLDGKIWSNEWWTQDEAPDVSKAYGVWRIVDDCNL